MLMQILGTVPTENVGKALEKYIRYWITVCHCFSEITSCSSIYCVIKCWHSNLGLSLPSFTLIDILYLPKNLSLENFRNLLNYNSSHVKFYTSVTCSLNHKFGKFHCSIHKIDKIMLLLIMATWQFWHYPKLSRVNIVIMNSLLRCSKCTNCPSSVYSLNLILKLGSVWLSVYKLFLALDETQRASNIAHPNMIVWGTNLES